MRAQVALDHFEELLPLPSARLDEVGDLPVGTGVERLEREVLELPLELLDTEAVRERSVDLEGLVRDLATALLRERREGSHVVEAVGEPDQQDPDVARHRDDHLADVLRLRELAAPELQLVELGEPVDDACDLVAELALDVTEADRGVLDGVVQEGRGQGRRVQAKVGEDPRHRDGMLDVGLAREAVLPLVRILGEPVRALQQLGVGLGVVRANLLQHRGEAVRGPGVRAPEAWPRDTREPPAALGRDRLRLLLDPHVTPGGVHARLLPESVGDTVIQTPYERRRAGRS